MEKRYTKKDFYVGQEVYAECINVGGLSFLNKGDIVEEVVTKVGELYIATNKRDYIIESGLELSDYSPNFMVWTDKNDVEAKVAKDKVYSKLLREFSMWRGSLQSQRLYKKLSLEDLQKIEQIVDKAMEE